MAVPEQVPEEIRCLQAKLPGKGLLAEEVLVCVNSL